MCIPAVVYQVCVRFQWVCHGLGHHSIIPCRGLGHHSIMTCRGLGHHSIMPCRGLKYIYCFPACSSVPGMHQVPVTMPRTLASYLTTMNTLKYDISQFGQSMCLNDRLDHSHHKENIFLNKRRIFFPFINLENPLYFWPNLKCIFDYQKSCFAKGLKK